MQGMVGVVYGGPKLLISPQPGSKTRKDWDSNVPFIGMPSYPKILSLDPTSMVLPSPSSTWDWWPTLYKTVWETQVRFKPSQVCSFSASVSSPINPSLTFKDLDVSGTSLGGLGTGTGLMTGSVNLYMEEGCLCLRLERRWTRAAPGDMLSTHKKSKREGWQGGSVCRHAIKPDHPVQSSGLYSGRSELSPFTRLSSRVSEGWWHVCNPFIHIYTW